MLAKIIIEINEPYLWYLLCEYNRVTMRKLSIYAALL